MFPEWSYVLCGGGVHLFQMPPDLVAYAAFYLAQKPRATE